MNRPSYWMDTCPPIWGTPKRPPNSDVLVIGAGFAGLSTAGYLHLNGTDVTVVDNGRPGSYAYNAGQVTMHLAEPWERMQEVHGAKKTRDLQVYVMKCAEAVRAAYPALEVGYYRDDWALSQRIDYWIASGGYFGHPVRFRNQLANEVDKQYYSYAPVTKIARSPDGTKVLVYYHVGERIESTEHEMVVICTNAFSKEFELPVDPFGGFIMVSKPLPRRCRPMAFSANNGLIYGQITVDNRMLLGGWRTMQGDPKKGLTNWVATWFDQAGALEWAQSWTGQMAATPDGLPLVGPTADHRVWCATGFNGYGFGMGYKVGIDVARLILGETVDPVIQEQFSLGRFKV
jgi:glycine/D-amino acid oxidase-like deaminating enzyme